MRNDPYEIMAEVEAVRLISPLPNLSNASGNDEETTQKFTAIDETITQLQSELAALSEIATSNQQQQQQQQDEMAWIADLKALSTFAQKGISFKPYLLELLRETPREYAFNATIPPEWLGRAGVRFIRLVKQNGTVEYDTPQLFSTIGYSKQTVVYSGKAKGVVKVQILYLLLDIDDNAKSDVSEVVE